MKNQNSSYNFTQFSIREEKDDFLLFLINSGKCFIINKIGKVIIEKLKDEVSMPDIITLLGIDSLDIKTQLELYEFVNKLIKNGVITVTTSPECENDLPLIENLENVHSKGKQCVTFGMPKRSCKSLPSGITEKNNS